MKTILIAALAVFCAHAVEPSASLFENADVKVVRALEKVHVKGSFHEHKINRVMIYLQNGKQRFEYQDGRKPVVFDWKAGQIDWSVPEGIHSPEVIGDEPFNIVEIELKKPGGGAVTKVDAKEFHLELENPQVRVFRLKLAAHQATPAVEFKHNVVAVFLSEQELKVTDAAGKAETVKHKLGDAVWEAPGTRKIENVGAAPAEIVLVEVRN